MAARFQDRTRLCDLDLPEIQYRTGKNYPRRYFWRSKRSPVTMRRWLFPGEPAKANPVEALAKAFVLWDVRRQRSAVVCEMRADCAAKNRSVYMFGSVGCASAIHCNPLAQ